jgi:hypothetical protein
LRDYVEDETHGVAFYLGEVELVDEDFSLRNWSHAEKAHQEG